METSTLTLGRNLRPREIRAVSPSTLSILRFPDASGLPESPLSTESPEATEAIYPIGKLVCVQTNLEVVDLGRLTALTELFLSGNVIAKFFLRGLPLLRRIDLSDNPLREISLDLGGLVELDVRGCLLRQIDLSKVEDLEVLRIDGNPLEGSLDLTNLPLLRSLTSPPGVKVLVTSRPDLGP